MKDRKGRKILSPLDTLPKVTSRDAIKGGVGSIAEEGVALIGATGGTESPLDVLAEMSEQQMLDLAGKVIEFVKKHTTRPGTAERILLIASTAFGGGPTFRLAVPSRLRSAMAKRQVLPEESLPLAKSRSGDQ